MLDVAVSIIDTKKAKATAAPITGKITFSK
jgi:hypothetical protein